MLDLGITLKNFRCFEDREPARLHLGAGLTSLVGPNNAGKSSLLRMFYELRHLFQRLQEPNVVASWMQGSAIHVNLQVPDPTALQCDANDRPMTLRFDIGGVSEARAVSAIEFEFSRTQPNNASATFFIGPGREQLTRDNARHTGGFDFALGNAGVSIETLAANFRTLERATYIGPFRNALNQGASDYYDLSLGTAFVSLWDSWKNGDHRSQSKAIKSVEDAIAHLFAFRQLEINPSVDGKKLRVVVNGQPFDLLEQGAGLAQFIVVFGTVAIRKSSLILIDEPELNLHPSLQVDFLATLGTFATEGVLFASHSIGLARSTADTIYSVQRRHGVSIVRRYEQTPNFIEFAGELSFSSFRELGFDRLLLVEGPTDVRTVQQLLRKLDKDHRVVVFPLLGHAFASGDHFESLSELTRVTSTDRISALVDSERTAADQPADARREAFGRACEKLGFSVHLTQRRAMENYFTKRAIEEGVGARYEALDLYEAHGAPKKNWSKSLNWKIAHALTLDELLGTDLLDFLRAV